MRVEERSLGTMRTALILGVAFAALIPAARAAADPSPRLVDTVLASVDGDPITLLDMRRFEGNQAKLLAPEERRDRRALIEAMVRNRMFEKEFERNGIHAEDVDVEAYIDNRLLQSGSSRAALQAAIGQVGVSWHDYFERMRAEVQRLALINREIRSNVSVTPEEIRREWQSNSDYETHDRVEIADIYLPLPASADAQAEGAAWTQAREVYELARRGRFGEAARKYSQGPTADTGGHLGVFDVASLSDVFAKQIGRLDEGQVTEPFEADGAIHLLKLIKKFKPGRFPLDEVRDDIREKLYDQLLEERFQRWIKEDLKKRHHVTMQMAELDRWLR